MNDSQRKEQMDMNMPKKASEAKYPLPKAPSKGNQNDKIGKQIVPKN